MKRSEYYGHWAVIWFRFIATGFLFVGTLAICVAGFLIPSMGQFRMGFMFALILAGGSWFTYHEVNYFRRETKELRKQR
jgi:hypothetical protein